jgi:hypothetical protein
MPISRLSARRVVIVRLKYRLDANSESLNQSLKLVEGKSAFENKTRSLRTPWGRRGQRHDFRSEFAAFTFKPAIRVAVGLVHAVTHAQD